MEEVAILEQGKGAGVAYHHGISDTAAQDVGMTPSLASSGDQNETGAKCDDTGLDVTVTCKSCHRRKKEVQAVNLCLECGQLHICDRCTDVHARNKATRNHVVVPLRPGKIEWNAMCKTHDSLLNIYCHDCNKSVCLVCVMREHGEHTVEELEDFVDAKVKALKRVLEERANRLKELQCLKYELAALMGEVPILDQQDSLIQEIEDHAEKCIQQVVKWKEDLKMQVKADYKVIRDIPEDLEKVQVAVERFETSVVRAAALLGKTEHDLGYLAKLVSLQQDLDAVGDVGSDVKGTEHWKKLREFHDFDHCFVPGEMPATFGMIDKVDAIPNPEADRKPFIAKEIFQHTMQTDSTDKFIPCVANLGKHFAVAHPTRWWEPSGAIDIYELPGTLKRTLKDHVSPLYDMSSTPDGKLAVLSDGTGSDRCSVKLFESEAGYVTSTCDIDITTPFSLGVTLKHQYVILGDNDQGERQITVADKEGVVESRCLIGKIYWNPRITCGRDFIFVGDYAYGYLQIYQIQNNVLQMVSNDFGYCTDLSATVWDDYYIFRVSALSNLLHLYKYSKRGNKMEWIYVGKRFCFKGLSGADWEASLSARDDHMVATYGCTIRVLKLK
ncbi:uncharacterized protein LOC135502767 [Lineus longissimus]|uniref:uncharacterized protein LOC135502767 n=1 Tax=Lineus longissimus TaxID=88925 RepID=UPI00315DE34E